MRIIISLVVFNVNFLTIFYGPLFRSGILMMKSLQKRFR